MQIRSRDILAKILNQNGNSLCLQTFKFVTIGLVKVVKGNKLCLVFVTCVISLENIRHFVLVPSPPMKMISFFGLSINYLKISKHKNDVAKCEHHKPNCSHQTIIKIVALYLGRFLSYKLL